MRFEQEAILAQRTLDARDPLHLAVALRDDGVVFLVDVHAIATLVLGRVARSIGGLQHLGDPPEVAAQRHHADARADGERARTPDELILLHCLEQCVRDAHRIRHGAVVQQQPELVAAESCERVVAAHATLQELGELSQQLVARDVTARVVDDLELIEIEITHRVTRAGGLGRVERALQADLELATVDQAGERVVARFIRKLPRQLVRFGDVGERALVIEDAPVLVAHRARILQHHDLAAVLAPEHQLGIADLAGRGHVAQPVRAVLGVYV